MSGSFTFPAHVLPARPCSNAVSIIPRYGGTRELVCFAIDAMAIAPWAFIFQDWDCKAFWVIAINSCRYNRMPPKEPRLQMAKLKQLLSDQKIKIKINYFFFFSKSEKVSDHSLKQWFLMVTLCHSIIGRESRWCCDISLQPQDFMYLGMYMRASCQ